MENHPINTFYQNPKFKEIIDKVFNGVEPLLNAKQLMFSLILNRSNGKVTLINKIEGETPELPFDWDMYLTLKAMASTIIVSGQVMRDQKQYQLFHSHKLFYDEALLKLHVDSNPNRQKLFFLSNSVTNEQVRAFAKQQFYQPIVIEESHVGTSFRTTPRQTNLNGYFKQLLLDFKGPLLFESGLTTLKQYLESTQENMFDLFIIGEYNGELPEKIKGKELDFDFKTYFDVLFTSENIPCHEGFVSYVLYTPKKKQ